MFEGDKADLKVFSDRRWIKQVLLNLVSNSNKFTLRGYIEVMAKEVEPGVVRFMIVDTGKGITEDDKKKLGNKFAKGKDPCGLNN